MEFTKLYSVFLLVVCTACQFQGSYSHSPRYSRRPLYSAIHQNVPTRTCETNTVTKVVTEIVAKPLKIYVTETKYEPQTHISDQLVTQVKNNYYTKYLTQTLYQTKINTVTAYQPIYKTNYQTIYKTAYNTKYDTIYQTAYKTQTLTKYSNIDHTSEKYKYVTKTVTVPSHTTITACRSTAQPIVTVLGGGFGSLIDVRSKKTKPADPPAEEWEWTK